MTTIAAAAATANAARAGNGLASAGDRAQIAGNFDQFLQLLTTQLKNQSPLEPLDTNQFTQQLVQFAQVEQQLKQNETLTALLNMNKSSTTAYAMGFVGARVTSDGSVSRLSDGRAEWRLNSPRGGAATITVKAADGSVVQTVEMALNAGEQSFRWDGRTSTGAKAPDGDYSIVIDARDATRNRITVKTEVTGVVNGVDLTGEQPTLLMGDRRVPLDKVRSVTR
jgi:flagellar basal-body rod modification protein FlgD